MEIGIDDDFIDDVVEQPVEQVEEQNEEQNEEQDSQQNTQEEPEDFVSYLLKSRGIEDKTKIKFENEDGEVEEGDWDGLSNEDKLNILESSIERQEDSLEDAEIQLINSIRESGLTPTEYLQYVESNGINKYLQENQTPQYTVDQYSDDELFLADFISRMGDVTDEEAQEALTQAKANETLFAKQIGAIRNEYKTLEEQNLRQSQLEQEQQAQEQYNQFAQSIVNEINDFTEFSGYDLNMENEDMQDLYDFITGVDAAGNNHFAKALADPKILVQTAWFALNGKQMVDDITEYFQKEITKVRKESYKKGMEDAKIKNTKSDVVFKSSNKKVQQYSDLDDF